MDVSTDKLAQGLQRLKQAGDNQELLGFALLSIHGALEDHFRAWLAANRQFPAEQRATLANRQQVTWDSLIEWMQRYGGLSDDIARRIRQANRLRQTVAHGGSYSGTRRFLDGYAALVRSLCDDKYQLATQPAAPAPAAPDRSKTSRPARALVTPKRPRPARPATAPARPPVSARVRSSARRVAGPAGALRRPANAPPPWPVGFVGRFLVFLIVVLMIYVAFTFVMQ